MNATLHWVISRQFLRIKNLEEKGMLGIIGAMDEEVAKIKEEMTDVSVTTLT